MSQLPVSATDQERYSRRLSDKIHAAFEHACEEGELDVAAELLETLEIVLLRTAPKADRREVIVAPLLAAHERLWHLRADSPKRFGAVPVEGAGNDSVKA